MINDNSEQEDMLTLRTGRTRQKEYEDWEYEDWEDEEDSLRSDWRDTLRMIFGFVVEVVRVFLESFFLDKTANIWVYVFTSSWLYYIGSLIWRSKQLVELGITIGEWRISFSYTEFKNLYLGLFLLVLVGNMLFERGRRTAFECLLPGLVPIASYYVLKASENSLVLPAAVLVLTAGYALFLIYSAWMRIRNESRRRDDTVHGSWYWIRRACAKTLKVGAIVFVLAGGIGLAITGGKQTTYEVSEEGENGLWEANKELLAAFQEVQWAEYTNEEKEELLGMLAQLEMIWLLGEEDSELNVHCVQMESETLYGFYEPVSNEIHLNVEILADRNVALMTLLHESYHRYQYAVVENLKFDGLPSGYRIVKELEEWRENFREYKSGSEDFQKYYEQAIEESAREYAEKWFYQYIRYIEQITLAP